MPSYYLTLVKKQEIAKDTHLFSFDLEGKKFHFIPGQHIGIGFEKLVKPDPMGNIKLFSLANAKNSKTLDVVMRLRDSGFKQTLDKARLGQKVYIEGPYGQFTLHADTKTPAVFIAGGVGLAPVRGIVKQVVDNQLKHKIDILYSDRNKSSVIYTSEFKQWQANNKNIKFHPTLTGNKADWNGLTGRIDKKMLAGSGFDLKKSVFYIVGSPQMVFDIRDILLDLGVEYGKIKTEEFAGY